VDEEDNELVLSIANDESDDPLLESLESLSSDDDPSEDPDEFELISYDKDPFWCLLPVGFLFLSRCLNANPM